MRVLLVVNPTASSVTPRVRADVERVLRGAHTVDVAETTRRDHAAMLARDAVDAGYDVVAVLAGDGTLNEAGGGLAGSRVALAPLPGGSTNVFARTLGIAYKPEAAAQQMVDALARAPQRGSVSAPRSRPARRRGTSSSTSASASTPPSSAAWRCGRR